MKTPSPILIAAALSAVAIVLAIGVLQFVRGSNASPIAQPSQHSATGNMLECAGGNQVQTVYAQMGDRFSVTGLLASKEPGGLLVRGPNGYIRMTLADSSRIEGPLVAGEPVSVTGSLGEDSLAQASDVRPACSVDFIAEVTRTPEPVEIVEAVIAQPTEAPIVSPAAEQVFDEQPDEDDDDSGSRGRGRGKSHKERGAEDD